MKIDPEPLLDWLEDADPLPELLLDGEPEVELDDENEDDPLDLLPDPLLLDDPLLDALTEPEVLSDSDSEETELDSLNSLSTSEPPVAGRSLWTQTPSAHSVLVPGM